MPLHLLPMTPSDTLPWIRLRALAYYGPTHDVLHRGPITESSIRGVAADKARDLGRPDMWHWKIVDSDLVPDAEDGGDGDGNGDGDGSEGRIIAVAVWSLCNVQDRDEVDATPGFLPPELRLDALTSLFGPLRAAQTDIMGTSEPYLMLNSFATHPEHQRRGAGKMLLEWGLRKADAEGRRTYLDATEVARPLYERNGFRVVRATEWDRVPWGGEGRDVHSHMVREPVVELK
ncbi:hypothetical protein IQ07DRAFT_587051 [Pyrenochaeta sp. DS3sAY3a]|nr:hypothetical protein IQ07DRAFT_587051 [Pyrenochaeta sp. DS3sAY3a]